ncbi:hypothetical protein, partial [Nocardioides sp.]|uniref:hypothetical protein n=1 Tax=Nocardioides sp. TaxID=35761 RepID=UPI00356180E9
LAATGAVLPLAPAAAAACTTTAGVTVVVDFHELGGGLRQVCDPGSGQNGAERFKDAGFSLDRVQRQPGFVCRVDGVPAEDPCVNTPPSDAYWSLWWSDGESGTWTFSSQGIDSLKVPDGGSIALSWKGSADSSPPGVAPGTPGPAPSPSASPSTSPSASPSQGGANGGGTGGGSGSGGSSSSAGGTAAPGGASSSPTATTSEGASAAAGTSEAQSRKQRQEKRQRRQARADASDSPTAGESTALADPAQTAQGGGQLTDAAQDDDAALPVWVAPVGIAVLFAAAGVTAVVRRRRGFARP